MKMNLPPFDPLTEQQKWVEALRQSDKDFKWLCIPLVLMILMFLI
jgi:hypothetical protein